MAKIKVLLGMVVIILCAISAWAAPGDIVTVAGGYTGDGGAAINAYLLRPQGITIDAAGNIYIADFDNQRIRKMDVKTNIITTVAGNGSKIDSGDNGPATSAGLFYPRAVAFDAAGNMYITDVWYNRIRKVDAVTGIITTVAGNGGQGFNGDGLAATSASLSDPAGIAVDASGNIYIADGSNYRVRKINAVTGIITTVAGNGGQGFNGDGIAATSATIGPADVALDSAGNLYIADSMNSRIRKVEATTGIITTVAGTFFSSFSGDNGPATSASLLHPSGVSLDATGNIYITDSGNNRVRKVDAATGIITTVAGNGTQGFSGDNGPAMSASLYVSNGSIRNTVVDASGNIFVTDSGNNRVRKIDATSGIITTVTGNGTLIYDNVPATLATLNYPKGVSVDFAGNIYIADSASGRVRKVDATTGIIATVAGNGGNGFNGDGIAATSATIYPAGIALDSAGNLYIADMLNNRIRKVDVTTGIISTVAGNGTGSFNGDNGPATSANLSGPQGIAIDSSGNVYIADSGNVRIRKVDATTGIITTVAGNGTQSYMSADNIAATSASFYDPSSVAVDTSRNLYIGDRSRIRKVDATSGMITTVAGNTSCMGFSGDNGPATSACLGDPTYVAVDVMGNIYIADNMYWRIRKVDAATGIITLLAGGGSLGYSGDNGPAVSASLNHPSGVAVDAAGNIYVADMENNRIRKVISSAGDGTPGNIASIAGNGTAGFSGDNGLALSASLNRPWGVTFDVTGNVYIADYFNNRIRKVNKSTGIITTVAGNGGMGYNGDNILATQAWITNPSGVAVDVAGNIYIAERNGCRIRKVDVSTGLATIVAGSGGCGFSGDNGPATAAWLNSPAGIAVDAAGNIYIADSGNNRIRRVDALTHIITTVAGSATAGYSGDNGTAASASLNQPVDVAIDSVGNIYISDNMNGRIRKVNASNGIITTVTATLGGPQGIALDAAGNIYVANAGNKISKIDASTGIITTVAGGTNGFGGDGGPATLAQLTEPYGVAVDSVGNIYIADNYNNRIREVFASMTVPSAPTGVSATAGNGQATVTFTPPTSNGGSAITLYTVTASSGGITATGVSSPITITGLTNGSAYTFTVTATNSVGTGAASTPSNSVTPVAPVNGACGTSNGGSLVSAPSANLCSVGLASSVTGTGPWTWTCAGTNGGTTANCSANIGTASTTYAPVVSHGTPAVASWTVSFTDQSSDPNGTTDAVMVNWGDGMVDDGVAGGVFTHTYSNLRARNYIITHMVIDPLNPRLLVVEKFSVNVPQRYTVSGLVTTSTGAPMGNAYVYLKQNGHTKQYKKTASNGLYSFSNVLPGDYTVHVYKFGTAFGADAAIRNLSSNQALTITATNP